MVGFPIKATSDEQKTTTVAAAMAATNIQVNINNTPLRDHVDTQNTSVLALPAEPERIPTSRCLTDGSTSLSSTGTIEEEEYPNIDKALEQAHWVLPSFGFPRFTANLVAQGIKTVEDLAFAPSEKLVEAGVPDGLVSFLRDQGRSVMIQSEGGAVSCPRF